MTNPLINNSPRKFPIRMASKTNMNILKITKTPLLMRSLLNSFFISSIRDFMMYICTISNCYFNLKTKQKETLVSKESKRKMAPKLNASTTDSWKHANVSLGLSLRKRCKFTVIQLWKRKTLPLQARGFLVPTSACNTLEPLHLIPILNCCQPPNFHTDLFMAGSIPHLL